MDSFKIFLSHISLSLVADLEAAKLMLFENYWKRNICLCDVFDDVFGFSAVIHGDSLIPCCSFRRAFTPTTLECLGMPWNALECLGMTHSWLKIISGVQRTGDRWQRIELGETRCHEQLLCCKIWDSESLHWVHKSALLIIPAMQMSLMGSTTTRQLDVAAAC